MTKTQILVAVATGLVLGAAGVRIFTGHPAKALAATPEPAPVAVLTNRQEVWLGALEWQESQGSTTIINPKDSDGTPSYGCLQFKPGTFDYFSSLYKIATTSLMSCPEQRAIVAQMIVHHVNLRQQFPASVRKLGLPPMSISTTTR